MSNLKINVHHVTRVEGHGNIVVDVQDGQLKECELHIVETPRFFEAMLRDKPYQDAAHIVSRICGICAVGHATAALRATENALGVVPTEQTVTLRKLMMHGEIMDSHILHFYMLVAPDFLGVGSVIPLARTAPEVVLRALRMKKVAGDLCIMIAGRHTHPIAMTVGGFTHFPREDELAAMRTRLVAMREDNAATVELFSRLEFPQFVRDTEYIALADGAEYRFIDGEVASTDGVMKPISTYRTITNETIVRHSSAKHTAHLRDSYMVGALARFNVNYDRLHPRAKSAADALGLKPKTINPFLNSLAQIVEVVHCTEDAILLIDRLLARGVFWEEPAAPRQRSGTGAGGVEVPRGLLFHEYTIEDGRVVGANCVIPTGQNLGNIDRDMRKLVPEILDQPKERITHTLEMLVRAYDPCISCSTHLLNVTFIND